MPTKPKRNDIIIKGLEWGGQAFVGLGDAHFTGDDLEVTITLCGPRGGYWHRSHMGPGKAEELAHALLAKASELRAKLASAASQEKKTKPEQSIEEGETI
jgi:hypothetical protein